MNFWYSQSWWAKLLSWLLAPLALIFAVIAYGRRACYQWGIFKSYKASVPVIIVGNISVGGNGKTPLTLWLVEQFKQRGIQVGIISRGYGSKSDYYPRIVTSQDVAFGVGDEPLLLAQRSGVPVCIGANRQASIELLQKKHPIDVIISDDGLQHYALKRDVEIVVVDEQRQFGNGYLLPAGALREPICRLKRADFVVSNGNSIQIANSQMQLRAKYIVNLATQQKIELSQIDHQPDSPWQGKSVNAIAGIGNPSRFFQMLQELGFHVQTTQAFPDHYALVSSDLQHFSIDTPLVMTEKDAVKCQNFAQVNWWYIPVESEISGELSANFDQLIHQLKLFKE